MPSVNAHRAQVNGLSMYYEEQGSGSPLLLLHGGGSTAQTTFGAVMPSLAEHHHVIAPEQQAHGHTGDIDRSLSFTQMADDTAALLDQLGVAQTDVIGFSNGGIVAMQLALRHPEKVRRLIICSSPYARWGFPAGFWEGMDHASPDQMPAVLRSAMIAAAPRPDDFPRMFARQVQLMREFQDIPDATLRAIAQPALVMLGDADVMTPEHGASLARLLPHAKLVVMPGSGHGTYLGAAEAAKADSPLPKLTLQLVEDFLAGRI